MEGDAEAEVVCGAGRAAGGEFGERLLPERHGGFREASEREIAGEFGAEDGTVFDGAVAAGGEGLALAGFGGAPVASAGGFDGGGPVDGGRFLAAQEREEGTGEQE